MTVFFDVMRQRRPAAVWFADSAVIRRCDAGSERLSAADVVVSLMQAAAGSGRNCCTVGIVQSGTAGFQL